MTDDTRNAYGSSNGRADWCLTVDGMKKPALTEAQREALDRGRAKAHSRATPARMAQVSRLGVAARRARRARAEAEQSTTLLAAALTAVLEPEQRARLVELLRRPPPLDAA